jgi:hypothetical protein
MSTPTPSTRISAAAVWDLPLEEALKELSAKNPIDQFPCRPLLYPL